MDKKRRNRFIALFLCVLMTVSLLTPMMVVYAADVDQTTNPDIVRDLSLSYQLKGSSTFIPLNAPYEIPDITQIQSFHSSYSFNLKDNIDPSTGLPNRSVHAGDYYLIELPAEIQISSPESGTIRDNEDRIIAYYAFSQDISGSWQIQVTFTEYVDDTNRYDIFGSMEFDFTVDLSSVDGGETKTISIPIDNKNIIELKITKPVPPPTTPISLKKTVSSYNDQSRELVWNVEMMPATGIFSGCTFRDIIDVNRMTLTSISHGSVTLDQGTDYTYNAGTGEIIYLIPTGRDGVNYQNIIITTNVKSSIYESLLSTDISNQATLTGGAADVSLTSNIATHKVTPNWLGKSGTLLQGNQIQWTLQANITNQPMYNAVVTDYLQADVLLDKTSVKVGGTLIPVHDTPYTPDSDTEIYGVYIENSNGADLKVYLPRGVDNASTAQQNITFVTSIVKPNTVGTADPVYNNTAKLEGNFEAYGDGNGVGVGTIGGTGGTGTNIVSYGVAVPYVSVVKGNSIITADDKRNGTIPWTITAISNLSSYGGSSIVDTLPADQTYLPDEIYWGSMPINGTTEPKAEISVDGRTLTITFATTDNALSTVQMFYVKTKIDPQVYGQNLNRDFTNQAAVAIYDKTTGLALDTDSDSQSVRITNNVITKVSSVYNGNITKNGQNPRINYSITINGNLMPLSNVVVSDDLSKIVTEFRKSGGTYSNVADVKWTLVSESIKITQTGDRDSLNLINIINNANANYENDLLQFDFGAGIPVNDKYVITFTLELDVSQSTVFEQNGEIRLKGNVAEITAGGLTGTVSTPPTGNSSVIKNEVLGKSGVHSVAEQQIIWAINLNQHNLGLANELDNRRVVDILPAGLTLDPTSLKLYENVIGTDGNFITGDTILTQGTVVTVPYTYELSTDPATSGRYVLTVTLPEDDKAYILRFATDVNASFLGKPITNSAYFVGEELSGDNTNTATFTLSGTSGGGSTTKAAITVYKNSKDNGAALSGGVFALHWLRGGDPDDAVFVRNQTTSSGAATFFGLSQGEEYTITEVTPPTGYLLDDPDPVVISVPAEVTGNLDPLYFLDTPTKSGSWTPDAIKNLDGKPIVRDFDFVLKEIIEGSADTTVLEGITTDTLQNGDMSVEFTLADGVSGDGILNFSDSFIFDAEDPVETSHLVETHTFTLEELDGQYPGYGFDETVYQLVVKVYNVKGTADLQVVIEDENGTVLSSDDGTFLEESIPVFHNTYRAAGELVLEGTKELTGHSLAADQFSFLLYEGDTLLQTVGNKVGENQSDTSDFGGFSFEAIEYSQADVGTKTYRIVEQNDGQAGYAYDDASYEINVNILDQDDGTIVAEIDSIQKTVEETTEPVEAIVFENSYSTDDLSVTFEGTKSLTNKTLEDGQFTFILTQTESDGTPIGELERVTNMNGQIVFTALNFTQDDRGDTFYYQITEDDAMIPGVTCDGSVYSIVLTVGDNEDGTLSQSLTYYVDGVETQGISFTNVYSATDTLAVSATKTLTGKKMVISEFGFVWQQVDPITGAAIGDKVIVRNASTGAVFFPAIEYTQADHDKDFAYKIYELNEKVRGMTYDQTKYMVRVHVTDMGDGTLQLDKGIYKKEVAQAEYGTTEAITFSNSYITPDEGFPNEEGNVGTGDNKNALWLGFLAVIGILGAAVTITPRKRVQSR